jgi:diaminopimelate decarboxylase
MERVAELVHELKSEGHNIRYVDAGGGLGISYTEPVTDDFPKRVRAYADAVTRPLSKLDVRLLLEPGRSIIGPAGALVVRVIYRKSNNGKSFLVVDGAMNDLIRPALYGAHHEIVPVAAPSQGDGSMIVADVVGPICETGDFFARDRNIPRVEQGDLLAILDAGAYGMSISSNYNTRCRAAEVLVAATKASLVRRREVFEDMVRNERL